LNYNFLGNIKGAIKYGIDNKFNIQAIELIKANITKSEDNDETFEIDIMNLGQKDDVNKKIE
jgi:hypothetical protein